MNAYRQYDKEGKPSGFDWGLVVVHLGVGLTLLGAVFLFGSMSYRSLFVETPCRDEVIFLSTRQGDRVTCEHPGARMSDSKVLDKDGAFFNCTCE